MKTDLSAPAAASHTSLLLVCQVQCPQHQIQRPLLFREDPVSLATQMHSAHLTCSLGTNTEPR